MSLPVIDTLHALGNFPVVNSDEVQCGTLRLDAVLSASATELATKASKSYVDTNFAKKSEIPTDYGTYSKPAGGIPKSDLASTVQTSLSKADTALQTHQDVSGKADKTYVDSKLSGKADKAYVDSKLLGKADVNTVTSLSGVVDTKADISTVMSLSETVDTKADVSEVTEVSDRVSDVEAEQNTLSARMDTFTSLEEGSTTGDAELTDIRVAADGTTYDSAGTSVRSQVSELNSNLNSQKSTVLSCTNLLVDSNSILRIFRGESYNLDSFGSFADYSGYGFLCKIPTYFNGMYLNVKIKGGTGNVNVPLKLSVRDKDTKKILWQHETSIYVSFKDDFAYIRSKKIMFPIVSGLPETAYVFVELNQNYKLIVSPSVDETLFNAELAAYSDTYKSCFVNSNSEIVVSDKPHGYYCDFGFLVSEFVNDSLHDTDGKIEGILGTFYEKTEIEPLFSKTFSLDTGTYGLDDYSGYGYCIKFPKFFAGIIANVIVTPKESISSDYTTSLPVTVSVRNKDTKKILFSHTEFISVSFSRTDGYAKIQNYSIVFSKPVTNLPDTAYLCIALPIEYGLNVTTNNDSNKFTDLPVLNSNYKNLYIRNDNNCMQLSDGLYRYVCDLKVISTVYVPKYNSRPNYTLHDAFMKWCGGEKFPVAIAGDSTTDGYRTTNYVANTLGTDHSSGYLYTDVLQSYLRKETGNNSLRIYNAGFSGKTASWMLANFDAEFGADTSYSDVKMIGISFGINDRPRNENQYNDFKNNLRWICNKCFDKGIQPFLLTSQAGAENSDALGRYENKIMTFANKAKWELAEELGLEIIDISTFTANFLNYSNRPIRTILYDYCHFADYGHKYEGGLIFREFVPRTITVNGESKIGFETQGIKSDLQWGDTNVKQVQMLSNVSNDGFKTKSYVSARTDESDIIVLDTWVFIDGKKPLTLKAYCETPNTLHCIVDEDTDFIITQKEEIVGTLDLGLHHIVVKSGSAADIDFYGLKLV